MVTRVSMETAAFSFSQSEDVSSMWSHNLDYHNIKFYHPENAKLIFRRSGMCNQRVRIDLEYSVRNYSCSHLL